MLDNAIDLKREKYTTSKFKKLIKGIKTPFGEITISNAELKKIEYKFNQLRVRKHYFACIEPTMQKPTLTILDTDGDYIFTKAFKTLKEVFIAVVRKKENQTKLVTLSPNSLNTIEEIIKRGKIVSPEKIPGKKSEQNKLNGIRQFNLLEIALPFQMTKLSKKKKKIKQSNKNLAGLGVLPTTELQKMSFKTLPFTGPWLKLIGNPSTPFHLMFYGSGGSGKSTLTIQLAHYLAEQHNMKVLFLAKEEGISQTAQDKFKRLNAYHKNIFISDGSNLNAVRNFDVAVLDSVNELGLSPDNIRALLKNNPKLSTIQIFKATKDGRFLGQNDFMHLVQAQFKCEGGFCYPEKNRFGGNETIKITFK